MYFNKEKNPQDYINIYAPNVSNVISYHKQYEALRGG